MKRKPCLKWNPRGMWTVVLLAVLIAAPALAADVYRIGGLFSVTGPASFLGDPEKRSLEMAVAEINADGGIDGKMLEAVIYDTEGDPQKAVSGINKLINKDKVLAIIGPSTTPATLAVKNFAERARIPLISCAAGIAITEPVTPWTFKTAQNDALAVASVYAHMKNRGVEKIGLLTVADAFGESGKQQLEQQVGNYGLRIVAVESFGGKDTDMTAQLTKIRAAGPDAIVCWGTNPGPAVVAKNIRQLQIDVPLYQSHGVASPKFIELAGEAAEGICLPTGKILVAGLLPVDDPQKEMLNDYILRYTETQKMPVSGFGGYAWDAMHLLAEAMQGAGGDRNKIRDNLEKIDHFPAVSGVFRFSPDDHNGLGPEAFVMVRIEGGIWSLER
ncbi:MAG: ABC transporter substrate-binding protein [Desulfobacterales bacterium]|nr:ABC transporter substrate-binding protein [Desulfobacteraceae bacterium]MDD3991134.1 ABC transporter substrate-binding protein [Desulfobacteraceae bacterium]MDY0312303.1 ABC transporter substrate-binding protein [Desulfobacterales bacterium]